MCVCVQLIFALLLLLSCECEAARLCIVDPFKGFSVFFSIVLSLLAHNANCLLSHI